MSIRARLLSLLAIALVFAPIGDPVAARAQSAISAASWLERPLTGWNTPGAVLSKAALQTGARDRILARCQLTLLKSTSAERGLSEGGWIPFLNFDQPLVRGEVEIVGGMTGADGMCRPTGYNIFVFAGGRFAGTLSPVPMTSREDASSGSVRILGTDSISAEFVRYVEKDPMCCPSSRVTVRYRIDRSGAQPVVVPVDVRTTRSL